MLKDPYGCFVEWISRRNDCEGQRWKVIVTEKPTTLTKAHSGQETKALQPSPTSSVHGRRFLFRSQKRLQTKFGRGPHCSCKPIGQKPTTQIKHTPCVFLTPLINKNNVPLFLMLHPLLLETFPWYQRQMRPPSKKLMVLRGRVDQARTLWKPSPERLSRAGSVFLAKLERDGWVFDSIHVMV